MQKIEISAGTILRAFLMAAAFLLIYHLKGVIILFFLALIFMSAFNPWVDRLERGQVPRWLAVLFFYVVFFSLVFLGLAHLLPVLANQTQALLKSLPLLIENAVTDFKLSQLLGREQAQTLVDSLTQTISAQLLLAPSGIFRLGANLVSLVLNLVSFFVITFYLLTGHRRLKKSLAAFLRKERGERFLKNIEAVEERLGAWLRGEFSLMLLIGFLTYLGLAFLVRIPFALPLAIVAGLLEIVPMIGPFLSALPAMVVAAAFSPWKILTVVLLYMLIQQLENSLIVPQVMKKAVGMEPLLVLLALLVGGELAGPMGALLSVPVTATLVIIFKEFRAG